MTFGNKSNQELDKIIASEKRSIIYAVFIFIGIAILVFYISSNRHFMMTEGEPPPVPVGRLGLYEPVLSFQKKYSRWPATKTELENFVKENKIDFNLKPYQTLVFKPENDGSVRINYAYKLVYGFEQSTFVLSR